MYKTGYDIYVTNEANFSYSILFSQNLTFYNDSR